MKDVCEPFAGKKITVLGLGLLGRGVGDAAFLAKCGAEVLVTDKKTEKELAESVAKLKKSPNITFHLGGHRTGDFINADLVIKAAGVPLNSLEIAAARAEGIPVAMSTALFAKYAMEARATIIGVTGTRGKSTVAHLIFHALKVAGKRAHLGGNICGISTLAMLGDVKKGDIAVLELDSWQLQGFGDLKVSPQVAVFANLMPDHLNYYPNMETYFSDKANIFRYQMEGDTLFVGANMLEKIQAARPKATLQIPPPIPTEWQLKILGRHNRENASFAAAALRAVGLSDKQIKEGLGSFEGVEGRLQFVREVGGVKIYNDNSATTPDATIAGLDSLEGDVVLIAGGSEKGLSLEKLVSKIRADVSHVVLLKHLKYKGSQRLKNALEKAGITYVEVESLSDALGLALAKASKNVLFSPGFTSFGMFKNEYDRNDQFIQLVKEQV